MAFRLRCPGCQAKFEVAEEFAGRRLSCARCGKVFRAPPPRVAAGPAMIASPAPAVADEVDEPEEPPEAPRPKRKKKRKPAAPAEAGAGLDLVIGGGLFALGAGVTLVTFLGASESSSSDGRFVVFYGPMLYGLYRIGVGLKKLFFA